MKKSTFRNSADNPPHRELGKSGPEVVVEVTSPSVRKLVLTGHQSSEDEDEEEKRDIIHDNLQSINRTRPT